jgi:HSP20 family molecular chaperone IbpA
MNTMLLHNIDLVWKNFFDNQSRFQSVHGNKINYPVDIYLEDDTLYFDIATVGLHQEDIEILTEGETLRVKYDKQTWDDKKDYFHKGISRKSFDFAWKISNDFDLEKISASMKDGLLSITIPYALDRSPKRVTIQ